MHIYIWILLAITSLSMIAKRKGYVFGILFFISTIIGFTTFGFLKGLGYLLLLFMGSLIFHLIERFLSMNTATKLIKEDLEKR